MSFFSLLLLSLLSKTAAELKGTWAIFSTSNIINMWSGTWQPAQLNIIAILQQATMEGYRCWRNLAAAIHSKLESGIHILCSDDVSVPLTIETFQALKNKYPGLAPDPRSLSDPAGNTWFIPLQVIHNDVRWGLWTFPSGSFGGPDGLTPQNINDLLTGNTEGKLLNALTDLVNLMLASTFDAEVKHHHLRRTTTGHVQKRWWSPSHSVSLNSEMMNSHIIKERNRVLWPKQVGDRVTEGAIHAMHWQVTLLPAVHVIVKLDFSNALYSIWWPLLLKTVAKNMPVLY